MPSRIIRLIRHNERQTSRVGVVTGTLGTLDQFPTQEIGFRLPITTLQELEELFFSAMRLGMRTYGSANAIFFPQVRSKIKDYYPRSFRERAYKNPGGEGA